MTRRPRGGRRPPLLGVLMLAAGALLLAGLAGALITASPPDRLEAVRHDVVPPAPAAAVRAPRRAAKAEPAVRRRAPRRAARPTRVRIPAIGVDAPVIPLGLDAAGALEVPQDYAQTGWWTGGARPGERGPAVVVGHVDSQTGPAVFFRLTELDPGDEIVIERADGTDARFRMQRAVRVSKSRFPTAAVYGATAAPALRLITCGGAFDRSTGHYVDNTVVFAG